MQKNKLFMGGLAWATTEASLRAWFGAGVVCVGLGSNLITKELLKAGDYRAIAAKIQETVALVAKIRGGK